MTFIQYSVIKLLQNYLISLLKLHASRIDVDIFMLASYNSAINYHDTHACIDLTLQLYACSV